MKTGEATYLSTFELPAKEAKFGLLIEQYCKLCRIKSSRVLNVVNKLLILLQTPPPTTDEIDYNAYEPSKATPKFYNVIKQNTAGKMQKRVIKFTTFSLINVDGDLQTVNGASQIAKKSKVLVKNEITAENIEGVGVEGDKTLKLQISCEDVERNRTYICESNLIRNQILGEVFEICYWNKLVKMDFRGV